MYGNQFNNMHKNHQNQPYTPPFPQQRQPDANGYYHFVPEPQPKQPPKPKKTHKALRGLAAAAAVCMMSSVCGGGTAMWVLNKEKNALADAAASNPASNETIVQQTSMDNSASAATDGSIAAVAAAAKDSVVEIDTQTRQQAYFLGTSLVEGAGSGVIISEDGYIVTNHHVVNGAEQIVVRLSDGTEYPAKLVGTDTQTDLAVLKVEATGLHAATFADSDQLQVGDITVAIGNPLGELGGTVTNGIISATSRDITVGNETMTLLQTSAAINPGNSGGGLFNAKGELIGIVNAKSSGVDIEGLGFAIPSNTVKKVMQDIIDNGYVSGRPQMGIRVIEVDNTLAQMYGMGQAGVYVAEPGSNTGLQAGDRFVFLAGESIATSEDISSVLKKHNVGDVLDVTVERDGKAVETQVTLQEQVPVEQAALSEA